MFLGVAFLALCGELRVVQAWHSVMGGGADSNILCCLRVQG